MKRKSIYIFPILLLCIALFSGCTHTSFSYTFNVETGEQIKVTLDTTDGMKLSQEDGHFMVSSEDNEELSLGIFLLEEQTQNYFDNLPTAEDVEILDQTEKDGLSYVFYRYEENGSPVWNYIIKLNGAVTGIGITNGVSQESAEAVMSRLSFECVEE